MLGDVLTPASQMVDVEADHTYRIGGVYSFGRGTIERTPIRGAETKYKTLSRVRSGQLVYSKLKAWEGAVAIAEPAADGLYFSSEFPMFDIRGGLDANYLRALIRWPGLIERLRAVTTGIGARRERISPNQFLSVRVPLPPIDQQRRVAARVAGIAAHVGSDNYLWGSSGDRLSVIINRLFEVAASSTNETSLGEILTERRVVVSDSDTVSMAGIYSYGRGLFRRPSKPRAEINYPTLYRASRNQLVMSKLFAWEGAIALCTDEFEGAVLSPEFPTFDIDEEQADPLYVRAAVSRPSFYRSLAVSGMGNRRQRVNPSQLLAASIPLPSLAEQRRIAAADRLRRSLTELIRQQRTIAAALSASVLNEVFNDSR